MSLIDARHIEFGRGSQKILQGISLALEPGEIVTIVGPNGSGKSTLLRVLIGALKPQKGKVIRQDGYALAMSRRNCTLIQPFRSRSSVS